jgi:hypothetical protein
MRQPPGAPAPSGVLFPELLESSEPAPPVRPHGTRLLKMLARILLWSLITVGAVRGLLPAPIGPAPSRSAAAGSAPAGSAEPLGHRQAEAVAAAFVREYLTVGEDRTARANRLRQLTARGVDLRRSVDVPAGVAQYTDLVAAAGGRSVAGGVEVTVVAHVLHVRGDIYTDGGTLAFVLPLVIQGAEVAVAGRPRPTSVPVASQLSLPRPPAPAPFQSRAAERAAHEAVVAFVTGDDAALTRLGGGRTPSTRPFPSGWRVVSVGPANVTGETGSGPAPVAGSGRALAGQRTGTATRLVAEVMVRARPPTGPASYSLPVHLNLEAGAQGITVRHLDGGGSP